MASTTVIAMEQASQRNGEGNVEYEFYENHLRQQYGLLSHKGLWTQVMCWSVQEKRIVDRQLLQGEDAVVDWARRYNGMGNVFLGRNPRTKDGDVQHCTVLSLDIDPKREKDTAATEDGVNEAIMAGKRVIEHFQYGVLCCSGNGSLLLFPLREPHIKDVAENMGKALESKARELVEGLNVTVDSTFDSARLVKAMGCISTKGDKALWRHGRIVDNKCKDSGAFYTWLNEAGNSPKDENLLLPEIEKGTLDRSKTDFTLASRLKLQGFTAEDTYGALCSYATRPGREDDYKRIIQKVYFNKGDVSSLVSGGSDREIILVTPQSGLTEYRNRDRKGVPELPTGFAALDTATFGLTRGGIFSVGARTNCGKTTFAISVAVNLCRQGKRVLFLSTETTFEEVWDRYIAAATGVSAFSIQHGLTNGSTGIVDKFMLEFQEKHSFTVYDGSRPSISILRSTIETAKPDVVIFDYFQHVEARETRELEEFVMAFKDLAKENNIAVLMCAQLHDGAVNPKTNKLYPPTLGSMKNCKALNDESRVVLLLDWDRDSISGVGPAAVKVLMAKNKGPKADIVLKLDRSVPRFVEE